MSPRSCQQLPFSTFSITFLFWQGLLSLRLQLRGGWSLAVAGEPRGLGQPAPRRAAARRLPRPESSGSNQSLSCDFSVRRNIPAGWRAGLGLSVSAQGFAEAEARRLGKSGSAEAEGCYHRNWASPLKSCLLTHTPKGWGQRWLWFSQIWVWFCCCCFFRCRVQQPVGSCFSMWM